MTNENSDLHVQTQQGNVLDKDMCASNWQQQKQLDKRDSMKQVNVFGTRFNQMNQTMSNVYFIDQYNRGVENYMKNHSNYHENNIIYQYNREGLGKQYVGCASSYPPNLNFDNLTVGACDGNVNYLAQRVNDMYEPIEILSLIHI